MDRLGLEPGQAVVHLGHGTGLTTLELASRVGETRRALGVDIAEEVLARARQHAVEAEAGIGNAEFVSGRRPGARSPGALLRWRYSGRGARAV